MATMKHLSVLLVLTLLSFTHARDVQMFNKIPSKVNENVVVKEEQPQPFNTQNQQQQQQQQQEEQQQNFVQDNENSYGLYGHESGQLPPSTTTGNNQPLKDSNFPVNAKYLPKNYNTVAYVTQPEDFSDNSFEDDNNNNHYNNNNNDNNNNNNNFNDNNYYNAQEQVMEEAEYMDRRNNKINFQDNNYNNFQQQQQGLGEAKFMDKAYTATPNNNNYNFNYDNNNNFNNMNYDSNNNAVRYDSVQPRGMSDTRFLENGKYYYDMNAGRHSRDPVETAKEFAMRNQQYNPAGYRGNSNGYNNNDNLWFNNNNYNDNNNYNNNFMGAEDDLP